MRETIFLLCQLFLLIFNNNDANLAFPLCHHHHHHQPAAHTHTKMEKTKKLLALVVCSSFIDDKHIHHFTFGSIDFLFFCISSAEWIVSISEPNSISNCQWNYISSTVYTHNSFDRHLMLLGPCGPPPSLMPHRTVPPKFNESFNFQLSTIVCV